MKKLFLFLLVLSSLCSANTKVPVNVSANIDEATVFFSGAHIQSSALRTLDAGVTTLVFENLSQYLDPGSIQVEAQGSFTILSVTHQMNYLKNQKKTPEVKALEDSLETLQLKLQINSGLKGVYEEEKSMLQSNKAIKPAANSPFVEELEETSDFMRNRLSDLMLKLSELQRMEKKISEQINKIQNQLSELNARNTRPTSEIVVEVSANAKTNAKFKIMYFVSQAGWTPVYDLRATDIKSPVALQYKAKVFQNTGANWEDVKLNLSTGNPAISGTKPDLKPWYLNYYAPVYYGGKNKAYQQQTAIPSVAKKEDRYNEESEIAAQEQVAGTMADFTQVTQGQVNIQFNIKIPYTIPSDGKYHQVAIQNYELPASYLYYSAPKLDKDAFLIAQITKWDSYNILPGEANIYYEGTYVGKTYINTHTTKDTLDISLGRDKSIVISRSRVKDQSESKIFGSSKKETIAIEINIRNKKNIAIDIEMEDQLPVSSHKDIEVEVLDTGGAMKEESTGKLSWRMKMEPSESKKMNFKFSVKYPKEKVVVIN